MECDTKTSLNHDMIIVGDIDYYKNTERLADLSDELAGGDFVRPNSMWDWQESYHQWLINDATDTAWYLDIELNDGTDQTMDNP